MVQADQSHSTQAAFNIPQTMRAAVCTNYGDNFDGILSVQDDVATPQIGDTPPSGFKNGLLVRVLAVALAPGDVRAMSGKTREFQGEYVYVSLYILFSMSIRFYNFAHLYVIIYKYLVHCCRSTVLSLYAWRRCLWCSSCRSTRRGTQFINCSQCFK